MKYGLLLEVQRGFGRALVEELIAQDYKVVATARQLSTLSELPDKENILKISLVCDERRFYSKSCC